MNTSARMKTRTLVLLSVGPVGAERSASASRWARIAKTLERVRLLSTSPIASWRWAMAKRRIARLAAGRDPQGKVEAEAKAEAHRAEIRALPVIPGG
jgi:hypothetical protein